MKFIFLQKCPLLIQKITNGKTTKIKLIEINKDMHDHYGPMSRGLDK